MHIVKDVYVWSSSTDGVHSYGKWVHSDTVDTLEEAEDVVEGHEKFGYEVMIDWRDADTTELRFGG